jgi:hypothetical protein
MTARLATRLLLLPLCLAGCASAPAAVPGRAVTPARLYPLAAGSAWSYDVDAGDGVPVLAIARVAEAGPAYAVVQGGEGMTRYELRPDGIFRSDKGGYLLKAPLAAGARWGSGANLEASVIRTGVAIDTPAGRFQDCVEVLERGAQSGAEISTTYCPDVGPVQVVSSVALDLNPGQNVRVVARLRGFTLGAAH